MWDFEKKIKKVVTPRKNSRLDGPKKWWKEETVAPLKYDQFWYSLLDFWGGKNNTTTIRDIFMQDWGGMNFDY